jgi:TIR domain
VKAPDKDWAKYQRTGGGILGPHGWAQEKAMADIFISYAREDRETAKTLAQALAVQGWSVWWDRHIPSGRRFHDVIQRELTGARCVIALWSTAALGSPWVGKRPRMAWIATFWCRRGSRRSSCRSASGRFKRPI